MVNLVTYKCKYCGGTFANLPSHVKNIHPDKYKKGKRATTYGTLVEEKDAPKETTSRPKPKKKERDFVMPKGSYIRTQRKNPERSARLDAKLQAAEMSVALASAFKKKGMKSRATEIKYMD